MTIVFDVQWKLTELNKRVFDLENQLRRIPPAETILQFLQAPPWIPWEPPPEPLHALGGPRHIGVGSGLERDGTDLRVDEDALFSWTALHEFAAGITLNGATGVNVVTVPDNLAQAMHLVDVGGIEYWRVVSTDAQPAFVFNEAGADVDHRWEASGIQYALVIQGSSGYVGVGKVPTAPFHVFREAVFDTSITFSSLRGSPYIEVQDDDAPALRLIDTDGLEYLRVISTNTQPVVVFNEGGADIDYRWEASGQANALFIRGSDGRRGMGTNDPAGELHIVTTVVTNVHRVGYSTTPTLILDNGSVEAVTLQLAARDFSTRMCHIVMTAAPMTGDNKHWIVSHLGPVVNNRFSIGYLTSSASGFLTWADVDEHFVILTDGKTGFGTLTPGTRVEIDDASGLRLTNTASIDVKVHATFGGMNVINAVTGASTIRVMPNGAPGGWRSSVEIYNTDYLADQTNWERVRLVFSNTANVFEIISEKGGTGTVRALALMGTNIGIGTTTPATSAKLELSSTTGALLLMRMTTTQRDALTAVNGMVIYNTTTTAFNFYESGSWVTK